MTWYEEYKKRNVAIALLAACVIAAKKGLKIKKAKVRTWHVDLKSFLRGLQAMTPPHKHERVNYALRFHRGWWCCLWTPIWHKGRGPYVSIGLGFIAFHRGY